MKGVATWLADGWPTVSWKPYPHPDDESEMRWRHLVVTAFGYVLLLYVGRDYP